jgi:hypothetical protein
VSELDIDVCLCQRDVSFSGVGPAQFTEVEGNRRRGAARRGHAGIIGANSIIVPRRATLLSIAAYAIHFRNGKAIKQIKQGKARVRYWRALGLPNCARARDRPAELREHARVVYGERALQAMECMYDLFQLGSLSEPSDTSPPGSVVVLLGGNRGACPARRTDEPALL